MALLRGLISEIRSLLQESRTTSGRKRQIQWTKIRSWKDFCRKIHPSKQILRDMHIRQFPEFESWIEVVLKYNSISLDEFLGIVSSLEKLEPGFFPLNFLKLLFFLTGDARLEPFFRNLEIEFEDFLIPGAVRGGEFIERMKARGVFTPEVVVRGFKPFYWYTTQNFGTGVQDFSLGDVNISIEDSSIQGIISGLKPLVVIERVCKAIKKYMPVTILKNSLLPDGRRFLHIQFGKRS